MHSIDPLPRGVPLLADVRTCVHACMRMHICIDRLPRVEACPLLTEDEMSALGRKEQG